MILMRQDFIPATMSRAIGDGVFFRPIRSWHSGTYAGEKLEHMPQSTDRSGCLVDEYLGGVVRLCCPSLSVTHRLYWHENQPDKTISAFLSYPNGMGAANEYFWEALGLDPDGDITRYFGKNAETELEVVVKAHFAWMSA